MFKFSEYGFFEAYKTIRNNFRRYDTTAFVKGCLDYLHYPTQNDHERCGKLPWLVMLLIKWAIGDEQSFGPRRTIPSSKDILNVIQRMHDLEEQSRLPNEFDNITLYIRNAAYQQFIYQDDFNYSHLARQFILFSKLENDHFIKIEFRNLIGLSIEVFLELSFMLFGRFSKEDVHVIDQNFFSPMFIKYSIPNINTFLRAFSKPFSEIKAQIRIRNNGKIKGEEYYEQTPFLAFPLIEDGTRFICTDRHVLFRCIEHFIYDRMRTWNAQKFTNGFGLIFERSVETAIQHSRLPYIAEAKLKEILGPKSKLVDFIITDGNSNVFVDAKAVEMTYPGKVAHLCEVVEDKAEAIFKAITQANEVIKNLNSLNLTDNHCVASGTNNNYLIVVTYKDLYLGNGLTLYESIAKAKLDTIRTNYSNGGIPLENMYFLNIDEFELFADAIANGHIGLVEGLEKAKSVDSDAKSRNFTFDLHLRSWNIPTLRPGYLQDRLNSEIDKIKYISGIIK